VRRLPGQNGRPFALPFCVVASAMLRFARLPSRHRQDLGGPGGRRRARSMLCARNSRRGTDSKTCGRLLVVIENRAGAGTATAPGLGGWAAPTATLSCGMPYSITPSLRPLSNFNPPPILLKSFRSDCRALVASRHSSSRRCGSRPRRLRISSSRSLIYPGSEAKETHRCQHGRTGR